MTGSWTTALGLTIVLWVEPVVAENPPLPEGHGLAARYPGDVGITSDPAVIFADDFESYERSSELTSKWSTAVQGAGTRIAIESANVHSGIQSLEFTVPQTSTETGYYVSKSLSPEREVLFVRTYAKYDDSFNVLGSSHNGITMQAHYCCPGVPADGFNKFYVGYEAARFDSNTAIPGILTVYIYHPLQRDSYGDHFFSSGLVSPFTSTPFDFGADFVPRPDVIPELGRWYSYELMVQVNTPGLRDGRIAMWLDGTLVADFTNLRLRDSSSLKIDKISLELHVKTNNLAVAKKWYDDVVVSTSYIGPMVSPGNSVAPNPPTNVRAIAATD